MVGSPTLVGTLTHRAGAPALVGAFAELSRLFTAEDVAAFAAVSGDHNPLHLDPAYAATTRFGRCVVHGMLHSSLFSTIFATRIPGAVYVSQNLDFKAPVFVGDTVIARCGCVCLAIAVQYHRAFRFQGGGAAAPVTVRCLQDNNQRHFHGNPRCGRPRHCYVAQDRTD